MTLTAEERYALVLLLQWIIRSVDDPDFADTDVGVCDRVLLGKETKH